MSSRCLTLPIAALLIPLARAQSSAMAETLTPVEPYVIAASQNIFTPSFTTAPGAVTFTSAGATYHSGKAFATSTGNTTSCSLQQLNVIGLNGTEDEPGLDTLAKVEIYSPDQSAIANYDVHFQWTTSSGCPASSAATSATHRRRTSVWAKDLGWSL